MEQLKHRISVFIPSTIDGDKPAKRLQKKVARKAAKRFSLLFGGCTAQQAAGFWNSPEKGLIEEKQIIIFSNCTSTDKTSKAEAVKTFAKAVCKFMRQEAVTVEIDGTLQFIEA